MSQVEKITKNYSKNVEKFAKMLNLKNVFKNVEILKMLV